MIFTVKTLSLPKEGKTKSAVFLPSRNDGFPVQNPGYGASIDVKLVTDYLGWNRLIRAPDYRELILWKNRNYNRLSLGPIHFLAKEKEMKLERTIFKKTNPFFIVFILSFCLTTHNKLFFHFAFVSFFNFFKLFARRFGQPFFVSLRLFYFFYKNPSKQTEQ